MAATVNTGTLAEEILDTLVTDHGVPAEATADTPFELLELDSLVLVELAVVLSQRYQVSVGDDELHLAGTVAACVELLRGKGAQV